MTPTGGMGNLQYADPFLGNDAIALPEPEGIAATWFFVKAQTGNTRSCHRARA